MTTQTPIAPQIPADDPSSILPKKLARSRPLFDPEIIRRATKESFVKLNPRIVAKNPVMFVVEVGAADVAAGHRVPQLPAARLTITDEAPAHLRGGLVV